jgi:probable HAF family extracellular repeat protein
MRFDLLRSSRASSSAIFAVRDLLFVVAIISGASPISTFSCAHSALGQEDSVLASTVTPAANTYKIEDLGQLPTISDDVAVSLNRDGAVAYWGSNAGTIHAMLWQNGESTTLDEVPGYPNSIAHAINRRGDVAGWMNTSGNLVDSLSTTQGFVSHGGRIHTLPGLGGRNSYVYGLNDKGAAVGTANLANGARHAFELSGSKIADLGTLASGKSSAAYAVNNGDEIVGAADVDGKANHAVLWVHRKIEDLGTLPHGVTSSARAVNDGGQIAGFGDTPDGIHAFLYTGGAMQDLGTLGDSPSEASGINSRGEVVGASNLAGGKRHAFLWQDGRMIDLNAMRPQESAWVLLNAFSINDEGQIACSASRKGESAHLLLLTPQTSRRSSTH